MRAINPIACYGRSHLGADRRHTRGGPCQCHPAASAISTAKRDRESRAQKLGWASTCSLEPGAGGRVPGTLGRTSQGRKDAGRILIASCVRPKHRPAGGCDGGVSDAGTAWLAQGRPGHPTPESRPGGARGLEKKLPQVLAGLLDAEPVKPRRVRLMFQDEARFGRMVRIKRCWAPKPLRPVVDNGYERQFTYVYGAISPREGQMDWKICDQMNAKRMNEFLAQVSAAHPRDLIIMILDGASSHKSKELTVPRNIRFVRLPPYAPELNPQEHLWDELREKEFPNRVFDDMAGVTRQLEAGLPRLAADTNRLRSLAGWPWIVSLILKANENENRSP